MNLYDSGWNRQTDFSLVLVLLVVPLVLVLPLIVPWRVSRATSLGISLNVMFYLEQWRFLDRCFVWESHEFLPLPHELLHGTIGKLIHRFSSKQSWLWFSSSPSPSGLFIMWILTMIFSGEEREWMRMRGMGGQMFQWAIIWVLPS